MNLAKNPGRRMVVERPSSARRGGSKGV